MTKQRLHSNLAEIDLLTREELDEGLDKLVDSAIKERVRGIGSQDFRMLGTVVAGALQMGLQSGDQVGPEAGYFWSVMALTIQGLNVGATPDVVNFYKNDFNNPVFWQLNGNNFGVTFNKFAKILRPTEVLLCQNLGSLVATGTIIVSGTVLTAPAEMMGKLV